MQAGSRFGEWRLLDPLGVGGMGVVWRARHDVTGEIVALKTIRLPDPALLAGLRREVRALGRVAHPGVVAVRDTGVHEGLPWYAMELVDGRPLRAWVGPPSGASTADPGAGTWTEDVEPQDVAVPAVAEEAVPLDLRLRAVAGVAEALGAVHAAGVVHRDLKPDNVILRPDGQPVLVDFGLAAATEGRLGREATEIPVAGGTLAYIAPEQVRRERVDARADLYALGCVLYELLCGRPPFVAASPAALVDQHLRASPVPPSERVPGLPDGLDDVVLRLLAKRPSARFGYAEDVLQALAQLGVDVPPARPRRRPQLYRPSLVGRTSLLAELDGPIGGLAEGRGSLVLLAGASGMGKTRLAAELARRAVSAGARAFSAECVPPGDASGPLSALRPALEAIADHCRAGGPDVTARVLGVHGPWLARVEPAIAALVPPAGDGPVGDRPRTWEALAGALVAFAAPRPLVLVIDDLQWADDDLVGFLAHLATSGRLDREPVLVIGTLRSEEVDSRLDRLRPLAREVDVGPLPASAIGAMTREILAIDPPPTELVAAVADRCEGSPFFAAELVHLAIERGSLWRDEDGRWVASPEPAAGLPGSIAELLAARLDALPADARAVVEGAAVLGRRFDAATLATLLELDEDAVSERLGDALARHLVEEQGARFAFVHDKVREVAYARVPPDRRRDLHRRCAALVDPAAPGDARAVHLEAAGDAAAAVGPYRLAAREASARAAYGDAERWFRAAARLAPPNEALDVLLERLSGVDEAQGRYQEALAGLEALQPAIDASGDARLAAIADRTRGRILFQLGRSAEALPALRRAREAFEALGDVWQLRRTLNNLGAALRRIGVLDEALEVFQEELRRYGDPEPANARDRARALGNIAGTLGLLGRPEEAAAPNAEALALFRSLPGHRLDECVALDLHTSLVWQACRFDEALRLAEDLRALATHVGDRLGVADSSWYFACALRGLGRFEEAERHIAEAIAAFHAIGDEREAMDGEAIAGGLRARRGDPSAADDLRRLLADVLARYPDTDLRPVRTELAFALASTRPDEAEALLALVEGPHTAWYRIVVAVVRARIALARGEDPGAWVDVARGVAREAGVDPEDVADVAALASART